MGVVNLRVYNRERYKEYVASIIKKASSTVILMEYLKISNSIKETLPAGFVDGGNMYLILKYYLK